MNQRTRGDQTLSGEELNDLILAIAERQNRQAFAVLFKHFAPYLKTYLIRSGLTASVAEEIVQETMLTVWRKASYFDPALAGAATWIFTIARNLRIDHQRRDRRPEANSQTFDEEGDWRLSSESILITTQRDERVRAALAALSEDQAKIVRLSFFDEKPHGQIALELGIPLGTVKSRVRLAMNRLRRMLDDAL